MKKTETKKPKINSKNASEKGRFLLSEKDGQETNFIPLSEIAKTSAYSKNYINFSARQGKLKAEKIKGVWHTTEEWLNEFTKASQEKKKKYKERLSKELGGKEGAAEKKEEKISAKEISIPEAAVDEVEARKAELREFLKSDSISLNSPKEAPAAKIAKTDEAEKKGSVVSGPAEIEKTVSENRGEVQGDIVWEELRRLSAGALAGIKKSFSKLSKIGEPNKINIRKFDLRKKIESASLREFSSNNLKPALAFILLVVLMAVGNITSKDLAYWENLGEKKIYASYNRGVDALSKVAGFAGSQVAENVDQLKVGADKFAELAKDAFRHQKVQEFEEKSGLRLTGSNEEDKGQVAGVEAVNELSETSGGSGQENNKGLVLAAETGDQILEAHPGDIEISAYLMDSQNKELTNGEYDVRFSIYTADRTESDPYPSDTDAGTRIWEETRKVAVENGLLDVYLGEANPLPNLNFAAENYFVGIRVGEDAEMIPRKRIGAVPLARTAMNIAGQTIGNAAGSIPLSNGILNVNLNAELLGGHKASYFQAAGNYQAAGDYDNYVSWKLQTSATDAGVQIKTKKGAIFEGADGIATSRNLNTLTISPVYGSSNNTVAEGSTPIVVNTAGNLTGGGTGTAGGGISLTLNTVASPTFTDITANGNININSSNNLIFGGTTSLGEATSAIDSGAYMVGAFTGGFTNSSSANVQEVLADLDTAISSGGPGTIWSLAGGAIFPTDGTNGLAVGTANQFQVTNAGAVTAATYNGVTLSGNGTIVTGSGSYTFTLAGNASISGANTGDQNLWATINSQSGNTTANSTTDTLTINGGGIATTAISGDTLTITATEADTLATVTGRGASTTNQLSFNYNSGAPFTVLNSTEITNLNANYLQGHDASYFQTALTNPVTGTGTNGYVAVWNGTNSITSQQYLNVSQGGTGAGTFSSNYLLKGNGTSAISSSVIYDNGTNVGIGTTSVGTYKLNVNGTGNFTALTISGSTVSADTAQAYVSSALSTGLLKVTTGTGALSTATAGTDYVAGGTGSQYQVSYFSGQGIITGSDNFYFNGTNVGIGTTGVGTYRVNVNGSLNATGYYAGGTAGASQTTGGLTFTNGLYTAGTLATGLPANGSITGQTLYWNGSAWTANANLFNDGTNVGIGTTNPSQKLDVAGNVRIGGSANIISNLTVGGNGEFTGNITAANFTGSSSGANTGDQNLWATINSQSGNTTANSTTDTLTINGGGIATTAISGDTLTITATEADTLATVTGRGASTTNQLSFNYNSGAPFTVLNSTEITNLNANYLQGHDASYFQTALTNPVTGTGTNGYVAVWNGTNSITSQQYLNVSQGGTGAGTFSSNYLLKGNGTSAISSSVIYDNGTNVGIGTTSVGTYKLNVNGTGNFTALTISGSTVSADTAQAYVSSALSTGLLKVTTGTGALSTATAGTDYVAGGTGSQYQVSYFSGQGIITGSDNFYFNGTNVGIGTTSPNTKLDVFGVHITGIGVARFKATNASTYVTIDTTGTGGESTLRFKTNGTDKGAVGYLDSTGNVAIYNAAATPDPIEWLSVNVASGNVGIGTSSPSERLHVYDGNIAIDSVADQGLVFKDNGANEWHMNRYDSNNSFNIVESGVSERLTILSGGSVGIGTTNPLALLSVGATSQFQVNSSGNVTGGTYNGNTITTGTGTLTLGSNTLSVGTSGTAAVGTGLANYVTRWTGTNTISSGVIYDNGTNVGIGSASPSAKLFVNGDLLVQSANGRIWGISGLTSGHTVNFQYGGDSYNKIETTYGSNAIFRSFHGLQFTGGSSNTEVARIGMDYGGINSYFRGNVGIGTTNPNYKLEVNGGMYATTYNGVTLSGSGTINTGSYTLTIPATGTAALGTGTQNYLARWTDANTLSIGSIYDNGTNVGIGTTSVGTYKLNVNGSLNAASYYMNGTALALTTAGTYTGQTLYWNNSTTQWTPTGNLFNNGTNVGIGTTSPTGLFQVGIGATTPFFVSATTGNVGIGTTSPSSLFEVRGDTAAVLNVTRGGNVGIGNTNPTHIFDTRGSVSDYIGYFYNSSTNAAAAGLYVRSDGTGNLLTLNYAGTDLLTVSSSQAIFNVPTTFNSMGDVSMAYDFYMTNTTAGYIKFNGPGYIQTESASENLNLYLSAANSGYVILNDSAQSQTITPMTNDTYDLGSNSYRFANLWLGGDTIHLGASAAAETWMSYDATNSRFNLGVGATGGAPVVTVNSSGNVGIGTTNPTSKFVIGADVFTVSSSGNVTGGTYNGNTITTGTGTLTLGSNTLSVGTSGTAVVGTGLANYVARWNGTNTLSTGSIYDNGTNVGIGTTAIGTYRLNVNGTINATNLSIGGTSVAITQAGTYTGQTLYWNNSTTQWTPTGNLFNNGTNVGIGTTSPTALLTMQSTSSYESAPLSSELLSAGDTWGTTNWTGDFASGFTHTTGYTDALTDTTVVPTTNYLYQISYTVTGRTAGTFTISFGSESKGGLYSTGTWGPKATGTGTLSITPTSDFNGTIVISIKRITGTYSPTYVLNDSTGTSALEIRSSTASLANTFIGRYGGRYNTTGYNNTALGYQSLYCNTTGYSNTALGTYSLYCNTTGYNNTALGVNSLYSNTTGYNNTALGYQSLYSNTTGYSNTSLGTSSLYSNTTGYQNVALGVNSLYSNTTGYYNTALGVNSLQYNTTGYNNTALGVNSLYSNTTGYNNTALGYYSGRYISGGGNNQTSYSSLYLGYDTRALADGDTNEIVIGASAIGAGSNSVTLGNTSITKTILQGNVGIGTTNPQRLLHVNGTSRFDSYLLLNSGETNSGLIGSSDLIGTTGGASDDVTLRSASDIYFRVSNSAALGAMIQATSGNVGIGTTTPGAKLYVNDNSVDISSASRFLTVSDLKTSGTLTGDHYAVSFRANATNYSNQNGHALNLWALDGVVTNPAGYTATSITGVRGYVIGTHTSGTVNNAYGVVGNIEQQGSGGTISDARALYARVSATGTVTNSYGLYIDSIGGTNTWGVYQYSSSNKNYFAGNVGIGTTAPGYKLEVYTGTATGYVVTSDGTWGSTSDVRMKKDIESMDSALDKVMALDPVTFHMKSEDSSDPLHAGFIAQDVEKISPELVSTNASGYKGLSYAMFTPMLTKAIQEQQAMINEQGSTISDQQLQIESQSTSVAELQTAVNDKLNIVGTAISDQQLQISTLQSQLADAETRLTESENNLLAFETSVNDTLGAMIETEKTLTARVFDHEDRIKDLEDKLATMTVTAGGEIPENIVTTDEDGNVKLAGLFEAKVVQAEKVKADETVAGAYSVKNDEDAPTVGDGTVLSVKKDDDNDGWDDITKVDGKSARVETAAVTETAKIFVSFEGDPGSRYWIEKIRDAETGRLTGEFSVNVLEAIAQDIKFSWFIVEEK
ncbi:MAG: tail fiber domain-containing protein [Candidatus Moranbacteria bacterium]|nr:tail fiber domain-containing protein [Candidatus Moranbacteria bacterium]